MASTKIRVEVLEFAIIMEEKLAEHDDRAGWKGCDPERLLVRIEEELLELRRAIRCLSASEIAREAADVANFAMMVADVCEGLPESARTRALAEIEEVESG